MAIDARRCSVRCPVPEPMGAPVHTRDDVVNELLTQLLEHRRLLGQYRATLFAQPRREDDAVKLVRAEQRLEEAIATLRQWQQERPTRWRNKPAIR